MANLATLNPFKNGHSKVGGRKKGALNFMTRFEKALNANITLLNENEELEEKKGIDWIIASFIRRGADGDPRIMGLILKYYGLLTDLLEVDSNVSMERDIPTEELFGELDRICEAVKAREAEAASNDLPSTHGDEPVHQSAVSANVAV